MRIEMLHKKDLKDVAILLVIVLFAVGYEWHQDASVGWGFVALWVVLSVLMVVPKKVMSYAIELNDSEVELKESLFSHAFIVNRNNVATVEIHEVDHAPIGLRILCKDDSMITFAPQRVDLALLERVQLFILEKDNT